jgi:hypothetical protein
MHSLGNSKYVQKKPVQVGNIIQEPSATHGTYCLNMEP